MSANRISHKVVGSLIFLIALFASTASNAWWHGGGGYHGGSGPGVVVGIPIGGYYANQCTYVQHCYHNGNCYQRRVCN